MRLDRLGHSHMWVKCPSFFNDPFATRVAIARVVIQMNARCCRLVLTDVVRSTKMSNAIVSVLTLGWT